MLNFPDSASDSRSGQTKPACQLGEWSWQQDPTRAKSDRHTGTNGGTTWVNMT